MPRSLDNTTGVVMRISDMLHSIASWLESPDNAALLLAEYDDRCMKVVSESCVLAAALLKTAATEVDHLEPPEESKINSQSIDELAALAAAFDASGNPRLKKQASVLDELLLTIAAPPGQVSAKIAQENNRLEELRKKYQNPSKELESLNKLDELKDAVDKSGMTKQYNILEAPLNTRYCPDHPGSPVYRVGEGVWQCELDKKIYNYQSGYTLYNGSKVPGGDVSNQTGKGDVNMHAVFDTREGRLNGNR